MATINEIDNAKGLLNYLLENCLFAYDQLCKINKELNEEHGKIKRHDFSSDIDFPHLGAMDRMIKDYLIVRVGGLFDKTKYMAKGGIDKVVSFEKIFSSNEDYKKIKEQEIIKYIIDKRHNFVAHTDRKFEVPDSPKICDSDLKEILQGLQKLLKN